MDALRICFRSDENMESVSSPEMLATILRVIEECCGVESDPRPVVLAEVALRCLVNGVHQQGIFAKSYYSVGGHLTVHRVCL